MLTGCIHVLRSEHNIYTDQHQRIIMATCTYEIRSIHNSDAHCCHMGTAIEHPEPGRVKPSLVIFDLGALWRSRLSVRVPGVKNYKWRLNPVRHRMLYSCTHMATVGVKGVNASDVLKYSEPLWIVWVEHTSTACDTASKGSINCEQWKKVRQTKGKNKLAETGMLCPRYNANIITAKS